MWPFGKREKQQPGIDTAAAKAFKNGQQLYMRKIFLIPGEDGRHLAKALSRIEAAGYRLEDQEHGGSGHQKYVMATFRLVPLSVSQ